MNFFQSSKHGLEFSVNDELYIPKINVVAKNGGSKNLDFTKKLRKKLQITTNKTSASSKSKTNNDKFNIALSIKKVSKTSLSSNEDNENSNFFDAIDKFDENEKCFQEVKLANETKKNDLLKRRQQQFDPKSLSSILTSKSTNSPINGNHLNNVVKSSLKKERKIDPIKQPAVRAEKIIDLTKDKKLSSTPFEFKTKTSIIDKKLKKTSPRLNISSQPSFANQSIMDKPSAIKVAVRLRPLSENEKKNSLSNKDQDILIKDDQVLILHRKEYFKFDYCFNSTNSDLFTYASQEVVYNKLGKTLLDQAFQGFNTCLFAYGQSGSGKTYTMIGKNENPGIIPRTLNDLYRRVSLSNEIEFIVNISFFEIYKEKIYDLLSDEFENVNKSLKVREHPETGPYVEDLSVFTVDNCDDAMELLKNGCERRSTAMTKSNKESSRSHSIFSIFLIQNKKANQLHFDSYNSDEPSCISKINLVDLAGSERSIGMTQVERLKECHMINKSLLTLGKVITQLAEISSSKSHSPHKPHIPYRDSVLTYLLKESLGGNSRTTMMATISPFHGHLDETISTLRYASTAQKIINLVHVNEDPKIKIINSLLKQISFLRKEVDRKSVDEENLFCFDMNEPSDEKSVSSTAINNESDNQKWMEFGQSTLDELSYLINHIGTAVEKQRKVLKEMEKYQKVLSIDSSKDLNENAQIKFNNFKTLNLLETLGKKFKPIQINSEEIDLEKKFDEETLEYRLELEKELNLAVKSFESGLEDTEKEKHESHKTSSTSLKNCIKLDFDKVVENDRKKEKNSKITTSKKSSDSTKKITEPMDPTALKSFNDNSVFTTPSRHATPRKNFWNIDQLNEVSKVDEKQAEIFKEETKKKELSRTITKDKPKAAPIKEEFKVTTPQKEKTPIKEELKVITPRKEKTPIKESKVTTPRKEETPFQDFKVPTLQKEKTPIKELKTPTPHKEETPVKENKVSTPKKELNPTFNKQEETFDIQNSTVDDRASGEEISSKIVETKQDTKQKGKKKRKQEVLLDDPTITTTTITKDNKEKKDKDASDDDDDDDWSSGKKGKKGKKGKQANKKGKK